MPKQQIVTRLDPGLISRLDEVASGENRSRNNMIGTLLSEALDRRGGGWAAPSEDEITATPEVEYDPNEALPDTMQPAEPRPGDKRHLHKGWTSTGNTRPGQGSNRGFTERELACPGCPEGATKWERLK